MHIIPDTIMSDTQIKEAIEHCNTDPIHAPQTLQPFGSLLVFDMASQKLIAYSKNISDFIKNSTKIAFGKSFKEIFGQELSKEILKAKSGYTKLVSLGKEKRVARAVVQGDLLFLEFQDDDGGEHGLHYEFMRKASEYIANSNDINEMFMLLLPHVREYVGFDRVMLYKFDENYDGEVIAESKEGYLGSFYGHSFPATDIPENARRLYEKSPIRVIPDIFATPVPIISDDEKSDPFDLSLIHSRAVAPIHIEYMSNMSVSASMSISILLHGKLWGLIACHHNTDHYVSLQKRLWCEELSKYLSKIIQELEIASTNYQDSIRLQALSDFSSMVAEGIGALFEMGEHELKTILLNMLESSGAAIISGERVLLLGVVPSKTQVKDILSSLKDELKVGVKAIDAISKINPLLEKYAKKVSGVLSIKLSEDEMILCFRPEIHKNIAWAGQPIKNFYDDEGKLRISPRKSFETYKEEKKLKAKAWSENDLFIAKRIYDLLKAHQASREIIEKSELSSLLSYKLLQAYEVMPQTVLLTDIDGVVTYVNNAFTTMTGYKKDEILGKNVNILRSGMHEKSFYADLWSMILSLKIWSGKIINRHKNGELFSIDATIAPIVDGGGEIIGFVGIEHNTTEIMNMLKQKEHENVKLALALEEGKEGGGALKAMELSNMKFQVKKEILTMIAHHWRQPLNVLAMLIGDIRYAYESDAINLEYINNFESKSQDVLQSLSKKINEFSTFFRPEGNKNSIDVDALLHDIALVVKPQLAQSNIDVELETSDAGHVFGYESLLSKVVIELLTNIGEITLARNLKSANVKIYAYRVENRCIIEVSDTCGGIENLIDIFNPYFTTKGPAAGLGMGLYEAKITVEKYFGGTIDVQNWTLGAKFTISLNNGDENEV